MQSFPPSKQRLDYLLEQTFPRYGTTSSNQQCERWTIRCENLTRLDSKWTTQGWKRRNKIRQSGGTSVAKPEELWQLQFKQDFPNAGQDKDIEMSKEDHQLRMVFDCGASFQGTSLNQQLLQGPYLTSSLVGVFVRF